LQLGLTNLARDSELIISNKKAKNLLKTKFSAIKGIMDPSIKSPANKKCLNHFQKKILFKSPAAVLNRDSFGTFPFS